MTVDLGRDDLGGTGLRGGNADDARAGAEVEHAAAATACGRSRK